MRAAQHIHTIGQPQSGKTTFMVKTIVNLVKNHNHRALVIDPDGNEQAWQRYPKILSEDTEKLNPNFKGIVTLEYREGTKDTPSTFEHVLTLLNAGKLQNVHLVCDDANYYMGTRPDEAFLKILRRKRQLNCDIWTSAHGYRETPLSLFTFITQFVLFRTLSELNSRDMSALKNPELHQQIKQYVDAAPKYHYEYFTSEGQNLKPKP